MPPRCHRCHRHRSQRVRSVLEIGGMTGGVSGDDRGFRAGNRQWRVAFLWVRTGVVIGFRADFQGVKEKNCYLGREKFFPPMEKKTGQAMTMTPLTVGAFIFA